MLEKDLSSDPLLLAEVFSEISRMHMLMGKYGSALSILNDLRTMLIPYEISPKLLELRKKIYILRMLIYKNKGDFKLSLSTAKRLVLYIEKNEDNSHSIYILALIKEFIAELFFLLDDNSEAMNNIQMALAYYRDLELTQYTSLQLADALIFASQIYKCILEVENSEAFLTEAQVIYGNKYGENHPVIGYISLQMSQIQRDKANYPKAILYGEKAIKILRSYYREEDENIFEGVKNLSQIYKEAEDINKSIDLLRNSIQIIDRTRIEDPCLLADNMYNLGLCYIEVNDYPNARKFLSESLTIYSANLVEDDLILNDILQKLTIVNNEMTKNPVNSFENSIYPKKSHFSHFEDGNLANSYVNLADILLMKSEFERSLDLYLSALKIKQNSNYNDSKMNDILMKIGLIYLIAGKYDESLKFFVDCLKFLTDISSNQMTEQIMRLNLIISHLLVILDQKPLAQEFKEKTGKILSHLRTSSKSQIIDTLLASHAQQFLAIDLNKERVLDKNEVLNDLLEILQIAFHYEANSLSKLDSAERNSMVSTIYQAQGEINARKNGEKIYDKFIEKNNENLNCSKEEPLLIKKMNSLMYESSNKNIGFSLKSPQSFSSSHKGTSLGHSGSTPRFRGDSMIFKKKSYINLEKNAEFFFGERVSNEKALISSVKQEKNQLNFFGNPNYNVSTPKNIGKTRRNDVFCEEKKMLDEVFSESKEEESPLK